LFLPFTAGLKTQKEEWAAVVSVDNPRGAFLAENPRGEQGRLLAKVSKGLSPDAGEAKEF